MNYIEHKGLSYSRIKSLTHIGDRIDSKGMSIGSCVDLMLTDSDYLDKIHVTDLDELTPQQEKFINEVHRLSEEPDDITYLQAFTNLKIKRGKLEDLVTTLRNTNYFEYLKQRSLKDKIILSTDDFNRALFAVNKIKLSRYYWYFTKGILQPEYYTDFSKIKPDIVIEDDDSIEPIDLKTMEGYVANFPGDFIRFGYNIQSRYYTRVLQELYPDKVIKPFKFLVVSTTKNDDVLEFIDDTDPTEVDLVIDKAIEMHSYCVDNSLEVNRIAYFKHKYDSIPLSELL